MNEIDYHAMNADLELRKKLKELLGMKKELEDRLESEENPFAEERFKDSLSAVSELIAKIRFISLDEAGLLSKQTKEE